ncbi:hypothetical protein BDZ97DRAFT_1680586 [Flammula alnicola]|nr:hypothetical protein BDZ97DRAFT_1680586 [Flammula alnicola]
MPILQNPNDAVRPDYGSDLHAASRAVLITNDRDNAGAIAFLENAWKVQNDADKLAWQAQLDDETAVIAENERLTKEAEDAALRADKEERMAEQKEDEKKNKAKFLPIPDTDVTAPDSAPIIVSPAVRKKLRAGDWVALWHFTSDGLDEVTCDPGAADYDAVNLVRLDGNSIGWASAHELKKSRAVIDDADLPWDDFVQAAPRATLAMEEAGWPRDRVTMFASFFGNLQLVALGTVRGNLEVRRRALLLYQSEQRKQWHVAILSPTTAYNLSVINHVVLARYTALIHEADSAAKERVREAQERTREARSVHSPTASLSVHTHAYFFSPTRFFACPIARSPARPCSHSFDARLTA